MRWVFRELRKLAVDMQRERIENINMEFLSIGMSNDFEVAIEEGASIVRIGSAIFGERSEGSACLGRFILHKRTGGRYDG